MVIMKSIFPIPFESPCDLGARKSFPNAPDYEPKLNSGLIVHLAAVSGKGEIDVGIIYTDVNQVQWCTTPLVSYRYCHRRRDTAHKRSSFSVYWGGGVRTLLSLQADGDKESETLFLKRTTVRWHRRSSPQWVSSSCVMKKKAVLQNRT